MIKDADYNKARDILVKAGSKTAEKSHTKHTGKSGSPDGHGKSLLEEAIEEFRETDKGGDDLKEGMTQDHYDAIEKAAEQMGIDAPY